MVQDLCAELAEAERFNELGRMATLRCEIDDLARQLNAAVDLYGKDPKRAPPPSAPG